MSSSDISRPKVLVISSSPFSTTMNNGKTLSSFFQNYGSEYIAQFSYSNGDCNKSVCDNYFFFTKEDVISGRKGMAYKADEIEVCAAKSNCVKKSSIFRKCFHLFSQARLPIAVLLKNQLWKRADYSKAYEWIDRFAPDLVFFQGFSMAYGYEFALSVCEKRNIPLILELTDDYTHRLYPWSLLDKINNSIYKRFFVKAIGMASSTIVISEAMKNEYELLYGGKMEVMMNSVDYKSDTDNSDRVRTSDDYVYAGNLLLNRWKVLRNFGMALSLVNPGAVLNIYTPDQPPKKILNALSKIKSVRYGGRLEKNQLKERLEKCEYVIHVEAFDRRNRKITRLSVSTKISEYLASGAKLIAVGPKDVASMQCLENNNLALCINNASVKNIADVLSKKHNYDENIKNADSFLKKYASASVGEHLIKIINSAVTQRE